VIGDFLDAGDLEFLAHLDRAAAGAPTGATAPAAF
jgi:hypothetical protein